MTAEEQIKRITECMRKLDLATMTQDELIQKVRDLSINEIEDLMWDWYCFISDVCDTLNM